MLAAVVFCVIATIKHVSGCTFQACKQHFCWALWSFSGPVLDDLRWRAHSPAAMSAIIAANCMRVRRGGAAPGGAGGGQPARLPTPGSRPSRSSILQSFSVRLDSKGRRNANDVRKVRDAILHGALRSGPDMHATAKLLP